jgi:hypothetical protein
MDGTDHYISPWMPARRYLFVAEAAAIADSSNSLGARAQGGVYRTHFIRVSPSEFSAAVRMPYAIYARLEFGHRPCRIPVHSCFA